MKLCTKCKLPKAPDEFSFKEGGKRRHSRCKQCRRDDYSENRDKHKQRYQNNRDKRLAEQRRQRLRRKMLVLEHYSGGKPHCECCKDEHLEFLTVDHIGGGGEQHRRELAGKNKPSANGRPNIGGGAIYRWLIKNNFPVGFRILCGNCNQSYGLYGYCPHQREDFTNSPTMPQTRSATTS